MARNRLRSTRVLRDFITTVLDAKASMTARQLLLDTLQQDWGMPNPPVPARLAITVPREPAQRHLCARWGTARPEDRAKLERFVGRVQDNPRHALQGTTARTIAVLLQDHVQLDIIVYR